MHVFLKGNKINFPLFKSRQNLYYLQKHESILFSSNKLWKLDRSIFGRFLNNISAGIFMFFSVFERKKNKFSTYQIQKKCMLSLEARKHLTFDIPTLSDTFRNFPTLSETFRHCSIYKQFKVRITSLRQEPGPGPYLELHWQAICAKAPRWERLYLNHNPMPMENPKYA